MEVLWYASEVSLVQKVNCGDMGGMFVGGEGQGPLVLRSPLIDAAAGDSELTFISASKEHHSKQQAGH